MAISRILFPDADVLILPEELRPVWNAAQKQLGRTETWN